MFVAELSLHEITQDTLQDAATLGAFYSAYDIFVSVSGLLLQDRFELGEPTTPTTEMALLDLSSLNIDDSPTPMARLNAADKRPYHIELPGSRL